MTQQAIEELRTLESKQGKLTPEQVIAFAESNPDSALHACFEWDNDKAAHAHRIEQAREIIRSVRLEVVVQDRTIRAVAYVRDPQADKTVSQYASTMRLSRRDSVAVLRAELSAVAALLQRVVGISEARADELPNGTTGKIIGIQTQVDRLKDSL